VSDSAFSVEVYQNPYLPAGQRGVSAVVSVTAPTTIAEPAGSKQAAEVIVLDCSRSMDYPPAKMAEARLATAAAVDLIPDGVLFAIIAGTSRAWPVYPADGTMAVANERTRAKAKDAVSRLRANGGTAIGQWLRLAHQVFQSCPATLRHAILLADGANQHETAEQLDAAIALCAGTFSCDCRGVGTDWRVSELRKISTALLGTLDIVPEPSGLVAEFEELMRNSLSKRLPDVALRIWTPRTVVPKFVRQVAPALTAMSGRPVPSDAQARHYPTGAWSPGENRDYHMDFQVTASGTDGEVIAARVSVVASSPGHEQVLGQGVIRVIWTGEGP
jgi:hypothetical protein